MIEGEGSMNRFACLAVGMGVAALAAVPAEAAQADYKFKLFGGVAYVTPMSDNQIDDVTIEATDEVGYEIGAEWKPFARFGFEVSLIDVQQDVEADGTTVAEIGMQPINITLNFHIINSDRFAWYIGPTVAFVNWDDLESEFGDDVSIDSEETFGVSTGIDIGLGERFALVGGLRWLDASAEDDAGDEFDVDPLFARLGIALRF
jgi:outer membrane protein W